MSKIISVHSFRGGTGKSNISANLAYLAARRGQRVAVLDTDVQSPGIHIILGMEKDRIVHTLSDFLFGKCELEDAVYDLSAGLGLEEKDGTRGALFLVPSSLSLEAITRIISEGYDVGKLNNHFKSLMEILKLDVLFLDTHPGFCRETLLTTAVSDRLVIVIRPDHQDFHGTAVLVEVAGRLGVPQAYLVINKALASQDKGALRKKVEDAFKYPVVGILPWAEEMVQMGSRGLFAREHPAHPLTREIELVADRLLAEGKGPKDARDAPGRP